MNNEQYKSVVYKKLWFINNKEKEVATEMLNSNENLLEQHGKPSHFVSNFLEKEIIDKAKPPSSIDKAMTLGGLLFGNVLMVGFLITAALLILDIHFILYKPLSERYYFATLHHSRCRIAFHWL